MEVIGEYRPDHLAISVTDNGVGMWNFGSAPARSLGMRGMRERIELLSGAISFENRPGYGTRIVQRFQLPNYGIRRQVLVTLIYLGYFKNPKREPKEFDRAFNE